MAEEGNNLAQATANTDTVLKVMAPNDTTPSKDGVGLNDGGTPQSDAPNKKKIKQKIKWIFFDCDNTLVLSEGLAFQASFDLVNEVLEYKGIDHRIHRDALLIHFMGLSFKGMCENMAEKYDFEWTDEDKAYFAQREEDEVIELFKASLTRLPGIVDVLVKIVRDRSHNIAVVSSSSTRRINTCLEKTQLKMFFLDQYIFSATSSLAKPKTKPDPAIYLHAMKEVGAEPWECVCIEDSRVGVMAAVAASICCIGYLGSYNGLMKQEQLVIDFTKDGVADIMWEWKEFHDILQKLENK